MIVECLEYENEAIAFLYSQERFLVDKLKLKYRKDVCKQVEDYISLDTKKGPKITVNPEYDMLEFTMILMQRFAGTMPKCHTKDYKIITSFYVAILDRNEKTEIQCEKLSVTVSKKVSFYIKG